MSELRLETDIPVGEDSKKVSSFKSPAFLISIAVICIIFAIAYPLISWRKTVNPGLKYRPEMTDEQLNNLPPADREYFLSLPQR